MKLCFICGAKAPNGTLVCRSWVKGIISQLSEEFTVTILSVNLHSSSEIQIDACGKTLGIIPKELWHDDALFSGVIKTEKPDVIVIFGTEHPCSLSSVKLCEKAGVLDRTVVFAQGLACVCAKHYHEGVPEKAVRHWTLRDILRRENIRTEQKRLEKRADDERELIMTARHFIGRTTMDRSIIQGLNPDAAYYKCNDILRAGFYEGCWRYDVCEKHRLFISQYYYPLKGFHILLEAAAQLKKQYPDLMIAAAGYNPIRGSVTKNETKDSSYIRYIKKLIRGYGLENHIELLGELDEQGMKEQYLKANVYVLPSTIENSPNSLAEAMMLGVPCVASDVGGVSDFAVHREEAYLYPSSASYLLAYYIDRLFSDPADDARIGKNARIRAKAEYDRETNAQHLEAIFKTISKMS